MDIPLKRRMKVEEEIEKVFQQILFLGSAQSKSPFQENIIDTLFYKMQEERQRLELESLSIGEINVYLKYFETIFAEEELSICFQEACEEDFPFNPMIRLCSHLKNQKMELLKNSFQRQLLSGRDFLFYQEELFERRLVESFLAFHEKLRLSSSEEYFRQYYKILFSFPGIETFYDFTLNLDLWASKKFYSTEEYLRQERARLEEIWNQEIVVLLQEEPFVLQHFLETRECVSYLGAYFVLYEKAFSSSEIMKKLETLDLEKKNMLQNFLNSYQKVSKLKRLK